MGDTDRAAPGPIDARYWGHHSPLWQRVLDRLQERPFSSLDWWEAYIDEAGLPRTAIPRQCARYYRTLDELQRYVDAGVLTRRRRLQRRMYEIVRMPDTDFAI